MSLNFLERITADKHPADYKPAPRELPSLFDGDDAAVGLVDRSAWVVEPGRIRPSVESTLNAFPKEEQ